MDEKESELDIEDDTILASIYIELLNERQLNLLYQIINSHTGMGHIAGSYPLGMYFVYNFPDVFGEYEYMLKTMDDKSRRLVPNLIIITAKHIMRKLNVR